jgi:hypothetical protein
LTISLMPQVTYGQESPIIATVNSNDVSTDELVILTVTVVDDSPQQPRPILPRLDGLAVIDLDISTDVSMVSGNIFTKVTYTYLLQPRRTGLLTIPPVTVKIDDEVYKAPPISIRVSLGAAPAPSPGNAVNPDNISPSPDLAGQDFFVEANVDVTQPYVGQQLIYTFRFYQALQVYRPPQFESPLFTGFETVGLPVREYNIDVADRTYLITEIRTGLFSRTSGTLAVGPARLMLPGNYFEDPVELFTKPVEIQVKPVPDNAPPEYSGAVGEYEIKAWFSPQVAVINQPSTFSVAVSGTGNVQALPEPIWPDLSGWRSYNSLTSLTTEMEGDLMTGTRVFERVVIPDTVGDFTINAASFVYFDPIAQEYRTIQSDPINVKVIPAPTPDPTALASLPTATPADVAAVSTPAPFEPQANALPVTEPQGSTPNVVLPIIITLFFVCGALPTAAILGAGSVWWWQKQKRADEALRAAKTMGHKVDLVDVTTLKQPVQRLHPALAAAMRQNGDNNYKTVSQALKTYLSRALKTPVNGLTRNQLAERLRQRGLNEALIKRINDCLAESEMAQYGPLAEDAGWSLMSTAEELLFAMDKLFGLNEESK